MTYARARLWIGIANVGFLVMVSVTLLLFQVPQRLLPTEPTSITGELPSILLFFLAYVSLSVPSDLLGGFILPKHFGKTKQSFVSFARRWSRGIFVHGFFLFCFGMVMMLAGRQFGVFGVVVSTLLVGLLMIGCQLRIAKVVGGLPDPNSGRESTLEMTGHSSSQEVQVVVNNDFGFTGGVTGFPGFERIIVPRLWVFDLSPEQVDLLVHRRKRIIANGSRVIGVTVALCWNLLGLSIVYAISNRPPVSVADVASWSLMFSIWSFFGLLLLPTLNRQAVMAADKELQEDGVSAEQIESVMKAVDRLQDDEPNRPLLVEAIFHPLPSVQNRLGTRSRRADSPPVAWHVARTALFLSWPFLGLLSRAVHCNVGRPELWVLLPCD